MVEIKQGNIFGRVGESVGKGLMNTVPKEAERYRLSQGLKNLEQESSRGNLTPLQLFTKASAIPGITPQMVQSFGELAKQQQQAGALGNYPSKEFPEYPSKETNVTPRSEKPSLTEAEEFAKVQEGYIPPTSAEIDARAKELFNASPASYGFDPNKAIFKAQEEFDREALRAQAHEKRYEKLDTIQKNVVSRLKDQYEKLKGKNVPADVFSKIEDAAILATKPKKLGGGGKTEQQAVKDFGDELVKIEKQYLNAANLGGWNITEETQKDTLASSKSLQKEFKKRDDLENYANTLIAEAKLTPKLAYAMAYPVNDYPKLEKEISRLKPPDIKEIYTKNFKKKTYSLSAAEEYIFDKTNEISEKLAPLLKSEEASPLAVAYELERKGYDPQVWKQYLIDHQKELNLKESQTDQLQKPFTTQSMNDYWLSAFSGVK